MDPERDLQPAPVYPFAGDTPAVRAAIGEAITSVDAMIWLQVRRHFPAACRFDQDDVVQRVRVRLWQYSIPRFDVTKNVKLSTFLHTCIQNAVRSCRPKRGSRGRRSIKTVRLTAVHHDHLVTANETSGASVEAVAAKLLQDADSIPLARVERMLFDALLAAPSGMSVSKVGATVGLKPAAACTAATRIKTKLLKKADAEFF